ncbi:MAG: TraR/DksA family transcriptional regulator [Candidatus Nanopelagicales bacterium]
MSAKTPNSLSSAGLPAEVLSELEGTLRAEIARLEAELRLAEDDLAGLIADSGDGAGDDQVDSGTKVFERDHELYVSANTRELLEQSRLALSKLEAGTYGVCESCGNLIASGRLRAFPRATLCIECKQREERR